MIIPSKYLSRNSVAAALLFGITFAGRVLAAETPDELYEKGRFAEAEKAYGQLDMDHPKDIRYRYNRGCAAFQTSDYKGAMAAFSSVLRRAKDDDMRFNALYNLGNTAFQLGDFQSAAAHYKQAIRLNPMSEDARYNFELSLREMEKQKKNKAEDKKSHPNKDSDQAQKNGGESKPGEKGDGADQLPQKKPSEQEPSQGKNQKEDKGQSESHDQKEPKQGKDAGPDHQQRAQQDSPKDLSGELKAQQALPEEKEGDQAKGHAMSMIDKKKTDAFLDNIKEDRSKFLRFMVPEEKKQGVQSGKDW